MLGLVPETFNPTDVIILVSEEFGVVNFTVMEILYKQNDLAALIVWIDYTVSSAFTFVDQRLGCCAGIDNYLRVETLSAFQHAKYSDFASCTQATSVILFALE